jgi:hypothetical protein
MSRLTCLTAFAVASALLAGSRPSAQQPPFGAAQGAPSDSRGPAPQTARAAAPYDPTGYWVSVVTEDWRWRMTTPPKGDYISIPLSDEGRKVAFAWDPKTEGSCKAYGAAGLLHIPTRLNISWQSDDVLKVEADAGAQTRLLRFIQARDSGLGARDSGLGARDSALETRRSLQGFSVAEWEPLGVAGGGRAGGGPPPRALKVTTTNLAEGWLRKNGVPYSDRTTLVEHWDRVAFPNGDVWLTVSQYVSDPKYLTGDYTTSMHFKREPDGSKFKPQPCREM